MGYDMTIVKHSEYDLQQLGAAEAAF